jgi:cell shape-determining protein MreD
MGFLLYILISFLFSVGIVVYAVRVGESASDPETLAGSMVFGLIWPCIIFLLLLFLVSNGMIKVVNNAKKAKNINYFNKEDNQ